MTPQEIPTMKVESYRIPVKTESTTKITETACATIFFICFIWLILKVIKKVRKYEN